MIKLKKQPKILRIAVLFVVLIASALGVFFFAENSTKALVASTTINSAHANFDTQEQGAWKITQTATASDTNTAELKIQAQSILKGDGKDKDIFIMMDTSGSMTTERIQKTTSALIKLANTLLDDGNGDNRIAFSVFNSEVTDVTNGFVDDAMIFRLYIADYLPPANGGTNYYKAIKKIDSVFEDYQHSDSRNAIVLFITDGAPVEDHPLEETEFRTLKEKYPWLTVQGIQFEMGDEIIEPIKKVSDNQFASNLEDVEDVVFEAAMDGYKYSQFVLTDYINEEYFELESAEATYGEVEVSQDGDTPKIVWNMSNKYRSGTRQTLTLRLGVKQACLDKSDSLCPVNRHTSVQTKLPDSPDESIDTTETPVLQFRFNISYDLNAPEGCDESANTLPADVKQVIYTNVSISDYVPTCEGYYFQGWSLMSTLAHRFNDNYFEMPEEDVVLRALWAKPSISKSMEGTVKQMTTATFKKAAPATYSGAASRNGYTGIYESIAGSLGNIEHIEFSDVKPSIDAPQDAAHDFSDANSELPIYGYFAPDTKTFYFYSDADHIYLNADSRGLFAELTNLVSLGDMSALHAENVTTMDYLFYRTSKLDSFEGVMSWNTSSLQSLVSAFYSTRGATNLHGLENWDVSHVTNMGGTFESMNKLVDVTALSRWQTGAVTNMSFLFSACELLPDLSGLEDWNVGSVENMKSAFKNTFALTNVRALSDWRPVNVTTLESTFDHDSYSPQEELTSLEGLEEWRTPNLTNLKRTFAGRKKVTSLEPIRNWTTAGVQTMESSFNGMSGITSLDPLTSWNTSSNTSLEATFQDCNLLASIGVYNADPSLRTGVANWDVSKVTTMYRLFWRDANVPSLTPLTAWQTGSNTNLAQAFAGTAIVTASGLEDWDVRKVTTMTGTFEGCIKLATVAELADWQTLAVTNISYLFDDNYKSSSLTSLHGLENWDVSKVTSMRYFCGGCNKLTSLTPLVLWRPVALKDAYRAFSAVSSVTSLNGLQDWRTPVINDMEEMLANMKALTDISALDKWTVGTATNMRGVFVKDEALSDISYLDEWDTSKVTNMWSLFNETAISDLTPLSNWDVSKVQNFTRTFSTTNITNLNALSGWQPSAATNMSFMFEANPLLTSIEGLQGWTMTSSLVSMQGMFSNDSALASLNGLAGWNVSKVTGMNDMFAKCTRLSDISALTNWGSQTGKVRMTYDMFASDTSITDVSALGGWNVESVNNAERMFQGVTGVEDFSVLNGWQLPSGASKRDMFSNTSSTATLPSWL